MDKSFFENEIINVWIDDNETEEEISRKYQEIDRVNQTIYDFVLTYYNYFITRRNYGKKHKFTMIEAHVLTNIVDNPGITISELAKNWRRSPSALSQTVKKLIKWEYVKRAINKENSKYFILHPTKKAFRFVILHKKYDNLDTIKLHKRLLKKFPPEDLVTFFNVMSEYNKILRELN